MLALMLLMTIAPVGLAAVKTKTYKGNVSGTTGLLKVQDVITYKVDNGLIKGTPTVKPYRSFAAIALNWAKIGKYETYAASSVEVGGDKKIFTVKTYWKLTAGVNIKIRNILTFRPEVEQKYEIKYVIDAFTGNATVEKKLISRTLM